MLVIISSMIIFFVGLLEIIQAIHWDNRIPVSEPVPTQLKYIYYSGIGMEVLSVWVFALVFI